MTTSTAPAMPGAPAPAWPTWRAVLAVPWQAQRNRGALPWWLGFSVLLLAGPPGLLWALGTEPVDGQALILLVLVFAQMPLVGAWCLLVNSLLLQNDPQLARLVPGQLQRLRQVLWGVLALLAGLDGALLGALHGRPLAWVLLVALVLAGLAACMKRPMLWLWWPLLGVSLPSWVAHGGAGWLLQLWQHQALLVTAAGGLALAALLGGLLEAGGEAHGRRHERLQRFNLAMQRGQNDWWIADTPDGPATGRQPGAWAALLPAQWGLQAYQAWLARLLRRPAHTTGARLMMGLGVRGHWTAALCSGLGTLLIMGLMLGVALVVQPVTAMAMGSGLAIAVLASGLQLVLQWPATLRASRHEQALLRLLPGAPPSAGFNAWLGRRLMLQHLAGWLAALGLLGLGRLLGLVDGQWPGPSLELLLAGVMLVPLTGLLLWRDWSRFSAEAATQDWRAPLLMLALAAGAVAWVRFLDGSLWVLGALCVAAAGGVGRWAWCRLLAAPPAWPVGHAADQRR